MIAAGGFLVIVMLLYFFGVGTMGTTYNSKANTESETTMEKEVNVAIKDYAFAPDVITVKKGTKVTWTNNDTVGHTATADNGTFDTDVLVQGESASYTFDTPGTYTYHCTPHPNMKGTIVVE